MESIGDVSDIVDLWYEIDGAHQGVFVVRRGEPPTRLRGTELFRHRDEAEALVAKVNEQRRRLGVPSTPPELRLTALEEWDLRQVGGGDLNVLHAIRAGGGAMLLALLAVLWLRAGDVAQGIGAAIGALLSVVWCGWEILTGVREDRAARRKLRRLVEVRETATRAALDHVAPSDAQR